MWVEGALPPVKLLPRERMALSDPISLPNSSHGMNPLTIVTKFGYLVTKCTQIFPMKRVLCDCCTQNLEVILMQFSAQVLPNSSCEMNSVTILHTTFEGLFCDN
jgi:hypothetical protein